MLWSQRNVNVTLIYCYNKKIYFVRFKLIIKSKVKPLLNFTAKRSTFTKMCNSITQSSPKVYERFDRIGFVGRMPKIVFS